MGAIQRGRMLVSLSILGYLLIAGIILMDKNTSYQLQNYISYLNESDIDITIKYPAEGPYVISATKQIGNNIQHSEMTSLNVVDGIKKIVVDIEKNSDKWGRPETY